MITLLGRVFLVVGFFPFVTLNIPCHSLLACKVYSEKSADNLIGVPLYITCCFFIAAFKILSLCLIFAIVYIMCLAVDLFGFILFKTLLSISFPKLGEFSAITSSNKFSAPFSLSSPSGTPII